MPQDQHIKIIGKIDLDEYIRERDVPVRDGGLFKILQIRCSFYKHEPVLLDFGEPLSSNESKGGYFSLLLGKNGVCKSSLLRELIEFFIDARGYSRRKKKSHVFIESVKYVIDSHTYQVECVNNRFKYNRDGRDINRNQMKYPLVIASTMGMFDKFPVNSKPTYSTGRYNQDFYHYVGPKASSNMFASKANVLLQLMSSLPEINSTNQLKMLRVILQFIGYEPSLTFRYQVREQNSHRKDDTNSNVELDYRKFYLINADDDQHNIEISFLDDNFEEIRSLPIKPLFSMRQNGMLKSLKCYFYKNGKKEVDADYLSSGEFNLLCIVTSIILAAGSQRLLLLLDEPEISQHPNWQLDMIPNLEKALVDYGCHFLIATHCHFLVSNLPQKRSNVICMSRLDDDVIIVEPISSDTLGWSAEEVLLKAFGVPTDRNRYLAEMVSNFLRKIGDKCIDRQEAQKQLEFFRETSRHLSEYDPLKKIIDTILKEFVL